MNESVRVRFSAKHIFNGKIEMSILFLPIEMAFHLIGFLFFVFFLFVLLSAMDIGHVISLNVSGRYKCRVQPARRASSSFFFSTANRRWQLN